MQKVETPEQMETFKSLLPQEVKDWFAANPKASMRCYSHWSSLFDNDKDHQSHFTPMDASVRERLYEEDRIHYHLDGEDYGHDGFWKSMHIEVGELFLSVGISEMY